MLVFRSRNQRRISIGYDALFTSKSQGTKKEPPQGLRLFTDRMVFHHDLRQTPEENFWNPSRRKMFLNEYGRIVWDQWLWIGKHFCRVKLDEFVVMPDHVHGILYIENDVDIALPDEHNGIRRGNPRIAPTAIAPPKTNPVLYHRRHNLLSKTMNAFKTTSSKIIHEHGFHDFAWQRSFHDRIVRDEEALYCIRDYIRRNPEKWKGELAHEDQTLSESRADFP